MKKLYNKVFNKNNSKSNTQQEEKKKEEDKFEPLFDAVVSGKAQFVLSDITFADVVLSEYKITRSIDMGCICDWSFGKFHLADNDNEVYLATFDLVDNALRPYIDDEMSLFMLAAILDRSDAVLAFLRHFPLLNIMDISFRSQRVKEECCFLSVAGPQVTGVLLKQLPLSIRELCPSYQLEDLTAEQCFFMLTVRYLSILSFLYEPLLTLISAYLRPVNSEPDRFTFRAWDGRYLYYLPSGRPGDRTERLKLSLFTGNRQSWSFFALESVNKSPSFRVMPGGNPIPEEDIMGAYLWELLEPLPEQKERILSRYPLESSMNHVRFVRLRNGVGVLAGTTYSCEIETQSHANSDQSSIFLMCAHWQL